MSSLREQVRKAESHNAHLQNELSDAQVRLKRQTFDLEAELRTRKASEEQLQSQLQLLRGNIDADNSCQLQVGQLRATNERLQLRLKEKEEDVKRLQDQLQVEQQQQHAALEAAHLQLQMRAQSFQSNMDSRSNIEAVRAASSMTSNPASREHDVTLAQSHTHDDTTCTTTHVPELTMWQSLLTSQLTDVTRTAPYFADVSSLDEFLPLIPDDASLAHMSREDLQVLVAGISNRMAALSLLDTSAASQPADVTQPSTRRTSGEAGDVTTQPTAVTSSCVNCEELQSQLDSVLFGPTSDDDVRIIPLLKQQLAQTHAHATSAHDVTALREQLRAAEAEVERRSSLERDPDTPLVRQMAQEIERLTSQVEHWKRVATAHDDVDGSDDGHRLRELQDARAQLASLQVRPECS